MVEYLVREPQLSYLSFCLRSVLATKFCNGKFLSPQCLFIIPSKDSVLLSKSFVITGEIHFFPVVLNSGLFLFGLLVLLLNLIALLILRSYQLDCLCEGYYHLRVPSVICLS
ncbi:unnamed protein product [Moneuplotes crassus]|uniref:Uncharacterized protein n=1 Tax=Euplotes crassus TaxID=5936 RepID=A0AAD1UPZ1_EUPCR|nr:unnamed protein product [Moneuplotes crassus]